MLKKRSGGMLKGQEFSSFEELNASINDLSTQGHHPLRIFNSQSAEDANKKRAKAGSVLTPIDVTKWRYAYVSYRYLPNGANCNDIVYVYSKRHGYNA